MRVVSLLPAATEIVSALGAASALVGVTHECDHPPEVGGLPRVTSSALQPEDASPAAVDSAVRKMSGAGQPLFRLDEPRIRRLRPTLLLTQELCEVCAVREDDVRNLAARLHPAPAVVTLGGTTLDGVFTDILRIADALGVAARGTALVSALQARIARVHQVLDEARAPRPRVAVIEWTNPLFAAGHWTPDLVGRAGGTDVLTRTGEHSRVVTMEEIRAADPDVVIVSPCGFSLARAIAECEATLWRTPWSWLPGRAAWAMDGNALLSRPGPRLVDALETLAAILHPDLFTFSEPCLASRVRTPPAA